MAEIHVRYTRASVEVVTTPSTNAPRPEQAEASASIEERFDVPR